jgi:hypothetical protein
MTSLRSSALLQKIFYTTRLRRFGGFATFSWRSHPSSRGGDLPLPPNYYQTGPELHHLA